MMKANRVYTRRRWGETLELGYYSEDDACSGEARAVVVMVLCVAHFVVVSNVNVAVISLMTGEGV